MKDPVFLALRCYLRDAIVQRIGSSPWLAALLVVSLLVGCEPSSKPDSSSENAAWKDPITKTDHAGEGLQKPVTYRAELDVERLEGSIWVLLNGYPTYSLKKGRFSYDHVDPPINTALVGERNRYTLQIEPWVEQAGSSLEIGDVEVGGRVSVNVEQIVPGSRIEAALVDSTYKAWSGRARQKWKTYRSTVERGSLDSMRAWASQHPMTVSATFDNEAGPDFSRIFEEAPRLPETPATRERLKDYTMHLRDLMAEKDTSALFEEYRLYYAQQYKMTGYPGSVQEDKASLLENVVMDDPVLDFNREDVDLRSWSDGRVWEIHRDGEAFFRSGDSIREVYVAEIGGDLKVVR